MRPESLDVSAGVAAVDVAGYLVHWHAPEWCAESVVSLLAQRDVETRVAVINNGGVLDLPAQVEVIESGGNVGYTGGANMGLQRGLGTSAPFILVGCHDVRLTPGSLRAMLDLLRSDPGLGIVGPVLDGAGGTERDLDWISGTALLLRREVAERVQFDERWGSYVEDVDFCFRTRDLGWRVGRAGEAHAITCGSVDSAAAGHLMHSNTLVLFVRRRMWREAAKRLLLLVRERRARTFWRATWVLLTFPFRSSDAGHDSSRPAHG
jgi:GT2 family glycosyltransferase